MRKWFSFLILIIISMTFLSFSAFAEDEILEEDELPEEILEEYTDAPMLYAAAPQHLKKGLSDFGPLNSAL